MLWTGHYWEHGWPDMSHGGDNMAMYAWHQMPAIDMLFNQFNDQNPQAQFGNVRAVKELSSVANQMGYVRTLSETYGGGGWDVTFEDLKRLGDWQYALGVNFMNQHLSHMTITGARKYDYPPVFTSLSPWWRNYGTQNDYFARLSLLLSQGEQINDILVLEPTTTAWLYYSYIKGHPKTMEIGSNFQQFVTKIEKSQVEYDLGSENIIKDNGRIEGKSFVVGEREYKKVVIPPMTENLNRITFQLLKKFVEEGGTLIAFSIPTLVDGKESDELTRFFNEHSSRILSYTEESTEQAIQEQLQNNKIKFTDLVGNDLYHHRRTYEDGELLFLTNSSLTETAEGKVSIQGTALLEVDATTGDIFTLPHEQADPFVETKFVLPPAGSLVLFCPNSKPNDYPKKQTRSNGTQIKADHPVEIKRIQDNVLTIDFCDLSVDGKQLTNDHLDKNLYTVEASIHLFKHFGMANPWNSAIQYRQDIVEKDTFRTGDVRVKYHFIVAGDINVNNLRLVAEQPEVWDVSINGSPVKADPEERWLDSRFGVYDIGSKVKMGVNSVELSVQPMSIYAEIAPVFVVGDFALEPANRGWIIAETDSELALGSWKEQGHPFYSWDVSYSKEYTIENTSVPHLLQLQEWNGTLSEVHVNGQKVGIIAYQPYDFDLTPYLKRGKNRIEVRVTGSLKNLLGPHYSQDKGIAGPWHWNAVHRQDPGNDYNLLDYGLMKDFVVVSAEETE